MRVRWKLLEFNRFRRNGYGLAIRQGDMGIRAPIFMLAGTLFLLQCLFIIYKIAFKSPVAVTSRCPLLIRIHQHDLTQAQFLDQSQSKWCDKKFTLTDNRLKLTHRKQLKKRETLCRGPADKWISQQEPSSSKLSQEANQQKWTLQEEQEEDSLAQQTHSIQLWIKTRIVIWCTRSAEWWKVIWKTKPKKWV